MPPDRSGRGISIRPWKARWDRVPAFPAYLVLAAAAQAVVLWPALRTPYLGDDVSNSLTSGYLRWAGQGWWSFYWQQTRDQLHVGRLVPLATLHDVGLFEVLHDRTTYKVLLIVATVLATVLIAVLIRRLGMPRPLAALVAALPSVCWQFHLAHDPLLAYSGLVQAVAIYVVGALLLYLSWLERGGSWRVVAMTVLFVCACLTYQVAYLVPLLAIPLAWWKRRGPPRTVLRAAAPAVAVSVAFVTLSLILGTRLPASSGYRAHLTPGAVIPALLKILTSGLPLINWVSQTGPKTLPATGSHIPAWRGVIVGVLLWPLFIALARSWRGGRIADRGAWRMTAAVVGVLMVTPALLTAIAPRYQSVLFWGWGYLPMFFAAIGWAGFGAMGSAAVFRPLVGRARTGLALSAVLAAACGAMVASNAEGNARVVNYLEPAARSSDLLEASFRHGVLAAVPDRGTVLWWGPDVAFPAGIWVPAYANNLEAWTRQFVDRPLTMRVILPSEVGPRICSGPGGAPSRTCLFLHSQTFWLRTTSSGDRGFVAVVRMADRRWRLSDNTTAAPSDPASHPLVFVRDPRIHAGTGLFRFTITVTRRSPNGEATSATVSPSSARVLSRATGWVLLSLPRMASFVASSLTVSFG